MTEKSTNNKKTNENINIQEKRELKARTWLHYITSFVLLGGLLFSLYKNYTQHEEILSFKPEKDALKATIRNIDFMAQNIQTDGNEALDSLEKSAPELKLLLEKDISPIVKTALQIQMECGTAQQIFDDEYVNFGLEVYLLSQKNNKKAEEQNLIQFNNSFGKFMNCYNQAINFELNGKKADALQAYGNAILLLYSNYELKKKEKIKLEFINNRIKILSAK